MQTLRNLPDAARCRRCDYPLRGLTEPRCPECGRDFDPENPKTYHVRSRRQLTPRFGSRGHALDRTAYLAAFVLAGIVAAVVELIGGWAWNELYVPLNVVCFTGVVSIAAGACTTSFPRALAAMVAGLVGFFGVQLTIPGGVMAIFACPGVAFFNVPAVMLGYAIGVGVRRMARR